jgi:hypothetical protein
MPTEKRPPEGNATGRARKKMSPILRDWYGEDGADSEIMKYLPSSQPVGDVLRRVMQKKLPHGIADFRTISERWTEIAGGVAARHTTPVSLSNKTLFIEVEHPAYLASVRTKAVQNAILASIAGLIGADKCTALTFTPAGRRRSV